MGVYGFVKNNILDLALGSAGEGANFVEEKEKKLKFHSIIFHEFKIVHKAHCFFIY